MITLLLGTDRIAKNEYISQIRQKTGSELEILKELGDTQVLNRLFEPQLFGPGKIVVLDGCFGDVDPSQILDAAGDNKSAELVILETSLDKRKKVNTEFLKDKRVKVVEFSSPVGSSQSSEWIKQYAQSANIVIEPAACTALARALLVDEDSSLDVLRARNEIAKLHFFAGKQKITADMVEKLTENILGVDIFELLNSIATKNKKAALQMLETYFETETADEKSNSIKLSALLADQFRSLLIVQDAVARNLPDEKILELTGWKSGRLYVMKKLSRNFTALQTKSALAKLENLDRELKTGSLPPHVILDLIIADL